MMRCAKRPGWVSNAWGVSNLTDRRLGAVRRTWNHLGGFECACKSAVSVPGANANTFWGQIIRWRIKQRRAQMYLHFRR